MAPKPKSSSQAATRRTVPSSFTNVPTTENESTENEDQKESYVTLTESIDDTVICINKYWRWLRGFIISLLMDQKDISDSLQSWCWRYHIFAITCLHLTTFAVTTDYSVYAAVAYCILALFQVCVLVYCIIQWLEELKKGTVTIGPLFIDVVPFFFLHVPCIISASTQQQFGFIALGVSLPMCSMLLTLLVALSVCNASVKASLPLPFGVVSDREATGAVRLMTAYCWRLVVEWLYGGMMLSFYWSHPASRWYHTVLFPILYYQKVMCWQRWSFASILEQPLRPGFVHVMGFLAGSKQSVVWKNILSVGTIKVASASK